MATTQAVFLGGGSSVFEDCATVGEIMIRIACEQGRFASDVVVLPVGSGEVLTPDVAPPPDVSIVLKKEEARLSDEECKTNIALHATIEDTRTVARALAMLEEVSPRSWWPLDFLVEACDAKMETTVQTLIRAGVSAGDGLVHAAQNGEVRHTEAVRILIDAAADINLVDRDGNSPLALATADVPGKTEEMVSTTVQILIGAAADVNRVNKDSLSPLMQASWFGRYEAAQMLIDAEADINHRDQYGDDALAVVSGPDVEDDEMAQILLSAGALYRPGRLEE